MSNALRHCGFFIWVILFGLRSYGVTPVILSTDVGNEIDDQWAIAYLLAEPSFDVRGIVSAHAPSLPAPSARATYLVLRDEVENRLGLTVHPPLFEGSSLPLENSRTPRLTAGTNFVIQESKHFNREHRLTILTIGAATDVASAVLADPTIADRINVIAMAFTNLSPGGAKEFNVQNDVTAWQVLLNSEVPLIIGSGDVCRQFLSLNFEAAKRLTIGHGAIGQWLWNEYEAWYYRNVKPLRGNDFSKSWVIWDIITLAYERGWASAAARPRFELGDDLSWKQGSSGKSMNWIERVDSERLWSSFAETLDDFQRRHAVSSRLETSLERASYLLP